MRIFVKLTAVFRSYDMIYEIIGIIGTVLVLIAASFKTTTFWGSFCFRVVNLIGSVLFLVYGILLPALSTAILNGALIVVNGGYLISLIIQYKKKPKA